LEGWKEWKKGGKRDQKVREARQVLLKIPILVANCLPCIKKNKKKKMKGKERKGPGKGNRE
jgi:hypothetical protein